MDVIEVIKGMRELLQDETSWTTDVFARDFKNRAVEPTDENACQWCLAGAMFHIVGENEELGDNVLNYLVTRCSEDSISRFNDSEDTSHEDIIGLLDSVIESNGLPT